MMNFVTLTINSAILEVSLRLNFFYFFFINTTIGQARSIVHVLLARTR